MSSTQLGFCVPIETPDQLRVVGHRTSQWNSWDGGQVGGCPSWLTSGDSLSKPTCPVCGSAMIFVAQIYAPKEENHSFHRSLYIFACREDSQVSVWRFNIPRDNSFWPYNGDQEEDHCTANSRRRLCAVCGFPSSEDCSTQALPFCGRSHQILHHSQRKSETGLGDVLRGIFTPMYELVVEDEPQQVEDEEDEAGIVASVGDDSDALLEQSDLNAALLGGQDRETTRQDDIMYEKFRDRIEAERMQVLRYGGSPLWMTAQTPGEIPACDNCGGKRSFEFQLMPQLLHYLKGVTTSHAPSDKDTPLVSPDELMQQTPSEAAVSELDWGVVAVYTCEASCVSEPYVQEHAFVQLSISAAQT